jgi:hypothetical protein
LAGRRRLNLHRLRAKITLREFDAGRFEYDMDANISSIGAFRRESTRSRVDLGGVLVM